MSNLKLSQPGVEKTCRGHNVPPSPSLNRVKFIEDLNENQGPFKENEIFSQVVIKRNA